MWACWLPRAQGCECAEAGIDVLLFDHGLAYPWSKTEDGPTHPNITRVADWAAVEASLAAAEPLVPSQEEEQRRWQGYSP